MLEVLSSPGGEDSMLITRLYENVEEDSMADIKQE